MSMQRWIPWLTLLLLAQLVITGLLWRSEQLQTPESGGALLDFDRGAVDGVDISDGGTTLRLRRTEAGWVLPDAFDFPAGEFRITALLDNLAALQGGLPVASSTEAAQRFRVAEQGYERRIRLLSGDQILAELYLGDAVGPRRAYGRVAGQDAIYALGFAAFEADADRDGWTDKTLLHRKVSDIRSLQVGDIKLRREQDAWRLADLGEGESTDQDASAALVARVAGLNFAGVHGRADGPPAGDQLLSIELTLGDGEPIQYRFIDPGQQGDPLLWVSDQTHVLRIASYVFEPLHAMTRAKLLAAAAPEATEQPDGTEAIGVAGPAASE
jgi:hypothetical protein